MEYTRNGGTATDNESFIKAMCTQAKRKLDKLGINDYTVKNITEYARYMWERERFDEVYVEYRTKQAEGEGKRVDYHRRDKGNDG